MFWVVSKAIPFPLSTPSRLARQPIEPYTNNHLEHFSHNNQSEDGVRKHSY